jgi:hypothetical protein
MKLVVTTNASVKPSGLTQCFKNNNVTVFGDDDIQSIVVDEKLELFVIGNVIGIRTANDDVKKLEDHDLAELFQQELSQKLVEQLEGRFLIALCNNDDGSVRVFSDRYSQFDCYYKRTDDNICIASDLSLMEESPSTDGYNQIGLAHALTVYGCRPAKQHTIYCNVHRLGVGEIASVRADSFEIERAVFQPARVGEYAEEDLERYADLFLSALEIRGSDTGNIVYLSSGWDSTSILGGLGHIYGAGKVRAVIGRMRYSERAGVINPFEIERAQKVADYFGVSLEIVEFDYTREVPKVLNDLKAVMKSNLLASGTILSHGILADYIASNYSNGESIFAGEISDGAHNLGFSQYTTIFHPVLEFREYSDKMASFLYGPTFLESFVDEIDGDDVVYGLLRNQASDTIFEKRSTDVIERKMQLLSSFFLRNQRLPLVSMDNVKLLTDMGRRQYAEVMEKTYLRKAAQEITAETNYSWYLHLYNSFHWQGSTVATLPLTAQAYGFEIQLPFYDSRLQEFLSAMPENWGRGLDLNPTKHPLKWMLKNKIDYPLHLQVGPHSYLYDVDHTFSHAVEIVNHSALTQVFRELLSNHPYHEIMDSTMFNLDYLDNIVDRFVTGEEIIGVELNVLLPVCFMVLIGWY